MSCADVDSAGGERDGDFGDILATTSLCSKKSSDDVGGPKQNDDH